MSTEIVHYLNIFLGFCAIILQIICVVALVILLFGPKKNVLLEFIKKHFLLISFLISLFAVIFSLVYSEIIHFTPCYLCWYQRVFMFPQIFLFGVAFWKKDRKVISYAFPLICAGFLVSIYQNFGYYFSTSSGVCDPSGISCYQQFVYEFGGYISIPMLALTSFFSLLVILLVTHFYNKETL